MTVFRSIWAKTGSSADNTVSNKDKHYKMYQLNTDTLNTEIISTHQFSRYIQANDAAVSKSFKVTL